jgi:hypothetical protein
MAPRWPGRGVAGLGLEGHQGRFKGAQVRGGGGVVPTSYRKAPQNMGDEGVPAPESTLAHVVGARRYLAGCRTASVRLKMSSGEPSAEIGSSKSRFR